MKHNPFFYNEFVQSLEAGVSYSVYTLMMRTIGQTFFHVVFLGGGEDTNGSTSNHDRSLLLQTPEFLKAQSDLDHFFRSMAFLRIHCLDKICSQRIQHFGKKIHHGYHGREWKEALTRFSEEPLGRIKTREALENPTAWRNFQSAMLRLERHPLAAKMLIEATAAVRYAQPLAGNSK